MVSVLETWEPVTTNHSVDFFLGLLLDFGMEGHGKEERINRRNRLLVASELRIAHDFGVREFVPCQCHLRVRRINVSIQRERQIDMMKQTSDQGSRSKADKILSGLVLRSLQVLGHQAWQCFSFRLRTKRSRSTELNAKMPTAAELRTICPCVKPKACSMNVNISARYFAIVRCQPVPGNHDGTQRTSWALVD